MWVIVTSSQGRSTGFVDPDNEECKRFVYVGTDSFREGRTCGEVMGQALNGRGKVAVVTGEHGQALQIRLSGFISILDEKYPEVKIVTTIGEPDRDTKNFPERLAEMLLRFPDLDGIYVLDGNSPEVVITKLVETVKAGQIKLVCHDMLDGTMRGVAQGVVTCTISQDPFAQGFNPVIYLYNYLVSGQRPPRQKMTTQMIRITREIISSIGIHSEVSSKRISPKNTAFARLISIPTGRCISFSWASIPPFQVFMRPFRQARGQLLSC